MRRYYLRELSGVYGPDEAAAIFLLVSEHYLDIPRDKLVMGNSVRLSESELLKLYGCCKDLKKGAPVQYILGEAWFYGLKLKVNSSVLIPRPETEEMVHLIVKQNAQCKSALDLCTGSGCIALALAANFEEAKVEGCDVSEDALSVAKENAGTLGIKAEFYRADVLDPGFLPRIKYDVIVSNPPYVLRWEKETLGSHVLDHEPENALFPPGDDPLIFYRRIASICKLSLNAGGRVYVEINPLKSIETRQLFVSAGIFESVEIVKELSGKERFIVGSRAS
jgi:release factor glutamine methyltransferase